MGSCTTNTSNINKTFIIEPLSLTGGTPVISACTAVYTNLIEECDPLSGLTVNNALLISGNTIEPLIDDTINLGTPIKRFRNINTVSGVSTVWSATTSVTTPELQLGLDGLSNNRTITANNSVIQDDCLNGGVY